METIVIILMGTQAFHIAFPLCHMLSRYVLCDVLVGALCVSASRCEPLFVYFCVPLQVKYAISPTPNSQTCVVTNACMLTAERR